MDTSKEYVLMCEKAEEIQDRWHKQLTTGDVTNKGIVCEFITYYTDTRWELSVDEQYIMSDTLIWLPRQDQLQDMVKSEPYFAWNYIGMLSQWVDKNPFKSCSFDSMEQIWLVFVMKEKFNKVYDNGWKSA